MFKNYQKGIVITIVISENEIIGKFSLFYFVPRFFNYPFFFLTKMFIYFHLNFFVFISNVTIKVFTILFLVKFWSSEIHTSLKLR